MLWLIAFSVLLLGVSLFLQKYANVKTRGWVRLFTSPVWIVGVLFAIGSFVLYMMALGGGKLAIIQPLMSLAIVVAMGLAAVFLKEKIAKTDIIGFVVILIGLVLISGVMSW